MEKITSFRGSYRFLSNFYPCKVVYEGYVYPTVEHAFQAAKCEHLSDVELIRAAKTPGDAKSLGLRVKMRADWEARKKCIMYQLLLSKFKDPKLLRKLERTALKELIEENTWHDGYWGICVCGICKRGGANILGELLMRVRSNNKISSLTTVKSKNTERE